MIRLLLSAIVLLLSISVNAQKKTYYYKLTKKSINGATSTNVSGGQFITFMSDICYESTKEGIGVGHGNMTLQKVFSDSNFRTYMGGCYYGSESSYKFTSDLSTLNVITQNGDVYLYKKSTPPSGVTTCSLIRRGSISGGTSGGEVVNVPTQPIYNGGVYVPTPTTPPTTTSTPTPTPTRRSCSHCHGSGTIVRESSTATYGRDSQRYCNICGRSYWLSSGHSHVSCPICHGRGYLQ